MDRFAETDLRQMVKIGFDHAGDAQTTGGYPRIACIIEADMYQLAQIPLGQPIHFVACSLEEALKARADRQRYLEQLAWRLHDDD